MVNDQKKRETIDLDNDPDIKNTMSPHSESDADDALYDNEKDALDIAHDMGLYKDADEENPAELNSAEEINKDEEALRYK